MQKLTIEQIPTHLGWSFTHLLPGTFKRNRAEFMHHDYPILAPLPIRGRAEQPLEGALVQGPFIYFVLNEFGQVFYVGKSQEKQVLKRWIRPGNGGPAKHYWTHSTRAGGCIFNIANGLREGRGPFHLRFASLTSLQSRFSDILGLDHMLEDTEALEVAERALIRALEASWNGAYSSVTATATVSLMSLSPQPPFQVMPLSREVLSPT
jgi:hypothetical protein